MKIISVPQILLQKKILFTFWNIQSHSNFFTRILVEKIFSKIFYFEDNKHKFLN